MQFPYSQYFHEDDSSGNPQCVFGGLYHTISGYSIREDGERTNEQEYPLFAVGAIGFVLLCYVVPDGKIAEVRQRQVDAAVAKQKAAMQSTESESSTEDRNRICL